MTTTDRAAVRGAWNDVSLSPRERAASLLAVMTTDEKIAQLGSSWPGSEDSEEIVAPLQETHGQAIPFDESTIDGLGHLTRPFGTAPITPLDGMSRLAELQRAVVENNRFGIPAIAHEECLTGFTAWQATVYPTPLAWASTFNPAMVRKMAENIGRDMAAVGIHQGLSPVLDVVRDYRWGRVEETMGEDPYLVSETGAAYVEGLQAGGVDATLKHFIGYSASRGGRNHAPVSIGPRELRDVLLPPFEKAITSAGAWSVMNTYTETDGVPAASDPELFTALLRDELGFTGTVVSDYWAIAFLVSMHRIVGDATAAGVLSLTAGIDIELPHTIAYGASLAGSVPEKLIDRAALRVLEQKARLGLLDSDWSPLAPSAVELDSGSNRHTARVLAEQSIVLLKNNQGVLPLRAPRNIAVIGPVGDEGRSFLGCYSFPNHVLVDAGPNDLGVSIPSLLSALREEFSESTVSYHPGVPFLEKDGSGLNEAVALAAGSDLVVLTLGDRSGMFGLGTSGEGCDVVDLTLPGLQDELARAVLDTGVPTVLVSVTGRPYAIGAIVDRAAAAVQAFLPGEEGASAIAGVLSGRVEPGGRLPVQIPGSASAQPGTYLAPPLALKSDGVSSIDPTPAFPFGFGLGYASVDIVTLTSSATSLAVDGSIDVTVTLKNAGDTTGTAVPQLYLSDLEAEVTRPVRQLVGYARVDVAPHAEVDVIFSVHADMTSFTGRDLDRIVEPGGIVLTVASHAADPGLSVDVTVEGTRRVVRGPRVMTTATRITTR